MSFSSIAISSLPDGGAVESSDLIPVQRGSSLVKATLSGGSFTILAGVPILAGQLIAISVGGTGVLAQANNASTTNCLGFASADIASGAPISLADGYVIAGSGLSIGSQYYLSATIAGAATSTVPAGGGANYKVPVGIAVSTTIIQSNVQAATLIP